MTSKSGRFLMKKVNIFNLDKTPVEKIDFSTPCIFFIGGATGGAQYLRVVSNNKVDTMLQNLDINANVYINVYDLSLLGDGFENFANKIHKVFSLKDKKRTVFIFQVLMPLFFTKYVQNLFDTMILPRIVDENGAPLPAETAKDNLRKIVFYTHCYGNRVVNRFDKMLNKKLTELNYSPTQVAEIQKQLVILSQSPSFVFNKLKSTYLNFLSMTDEAMLYKHLFSTNDTITYFEKYHIVSVPQVYTRSTKYGKFTNQEHRLWPLMESPSMTDGGKTMIQVMDRAFFNALTLPRVDAPEALLDKEHFDTDVTVKPWLSVLEHVPTQRLKNLFFSSVSISNRWKDVISLKIRRNILRAR